MSRMLLVVALLSSTASAHRPQSAEEQTVIDLPKISHVIAGSFEAGTEVFTVVLEYDEPFAQPFELLVPLRSELELHRPAYAIVGPGLPEPTAEELAWLPFPVEEGLGVFIERNDDVEREVYFETVMRRTMWSSGTVAVHLPQAALYEAWVWSPNLTTGDFQFAFGVEEDFSSGDAWGPIFADWGEFAW